MAGQPYFEDVSVGDALPTLSVTVDETQMFFFSAATYNGHRIHYDKTWATEVEGYPDILVHGPLQAALLARAVTDWAGPDGRLVSYAIQNRASAFPHEELRFTGTVTGKRAGAGAGERGLVDLEIRGEKGEAQVLMPGTATVSLPRRG
jgi:hydroxyacyl-ACP dehydratase HTD2-like protein with hotdog domain